MVLFHTEEYGSCKCETVVVENHLHQRKQVCMHEISWKTPYSLIDYIICSFLGSPWY